MIIVTIVVFSIVHLAPGDAAREAAGGMEASDVEVAEARERLGLDRPVHVQYFDWVSGMLRGDFGESAVSSQSVTGAIVRRLPTTASLAGVGIVIAIAIALPAGIFAAVRRNSLVDRGLTLLATVGIASPSFLIALILLLVFVHNLGWFPATGYVPLSEDPLQWLHHVILPGATLGVALAAELTRHLRASMIDVLETDYIRVATAQGLRPAQVLFKYALKNAMIPVFTVLGLQVRHLLGGIVIVETIFNTPGIGVLGLRAVFDRDLPIVQGVTLITALIVIIVNLAVDTSYRFLDPRVRVS